MSLRRIIQFIFIIEIVILLFLYNNSYTEFSITKLKWLVGVALCDVVMVFYFQDKMRRPLQYRIISVLFIVGYLIVFYQRYLDLILGNISVDSVLFVSSRIIIKCCILSTIGLAAFGFGYLTLKNNGNTSLKAYRKTTDLKVFRFMFFLSTVLYFIFNMQKIVSGSYSQENLEAEAGTMALYSDILFVISFVILIAHVVKNNLHNKSVTFVQYNNQFGWVSLLCMITYCFAIVYWGDRGPLIICLSVYFGAYFLISKTNLKRSTLIIGIIVSSILLSLLGLLREENRSNRFQNIDVAFNEIYNNNSIIPFTKELSSSVSTLHYSVYYVPDKHPYTYGVFPIRYIVSTIPFGDRLLFSIWPLPKRYISSAFFVTWLAQGENYTYGNGTSCNADLYLSFGLVGVVLGLWLWGLFICYLENKGFSGELSINLIIIYLFTCGYSIYVNRAYLLSYLNFCVFAIVLNFIIQRIVLNKTE